MFVVKNKYFLLIESIKDIDLKNIKIRHKFFIIYRNKEKIDKIDAILQFRRQCRLKAIKFYVANNIKLSMILNSDGIYLSSYNKDLKFLNFKKKNFDIVGSAHNLKEISLKVKQGCSLILLSKLFLVNYNIKAPFLGILKFNNFTRISNKLIPLGGIKEKNLNHLRNVLSNGFAILSEIKKKPAIFRRLF
ncbi:MAG: thiamine phosphate synthase [Pseudomonadota bacterium]|nr:thiamine phosphate synthase [Pseudomonadota bacterium]